MIKIIIMSIVVNVLHGRPLQLFNDAIHLEKMSTLYLPYKYNGSTPVFGFDAGAVEQTAYDPDNHIVYVIGGNIMHAIDIKIPTAPKIIYHNEMDHVDLTDIEFCGGYIFVAMDNLLMKEKGRVVVFHSFSSSQPMAVKYNITVGSLPDMLLPTQDCKTVVVAIEAEAYFYNGAIFDPQGGVGILKFEDDVSFKKLDFKEFDKSWSKLESRGLRFVYRENDNKFSNDVEPEYITYNKNETKAYVCLQENNAIAVIDLKTETIEDILPLGFKRWETSGLDASDTDKGVHIKPWPVFGMYQPDAIHTMEVAGESYMLMANEGDSKDYSKFGGFNEEERVGDIDLSDGSSALAWANQYHLSGSLQADESLGRLKVSNMNGRNDNGTFEGLYTFGGRSFSIRKLDTMDLVYDSGSQIEELHHQYIGKLFNSNGDASNDTIPETFDTRSDNKGPECESLAIAHIGGKVVLFVGNERPGSIFIYTITDDITKPKFESIWTGIEETDGTWSELYERRKISEMDPEDIRYIPKENSPTNEHMLIAAGSVSGTLSVFRVNGIDQLSKGSAPHTDETSHLGVVDLAVIMSSIPRNVWSFDRNL